MRAEPHQHEVLDVRSVPDEQGAEHATVRGLDVLRTDVVLPHQFAGQRVDLADVGDLVMEGPMVNFVAAVEENTLWGLLDRHGGIRVIADVARPDDLQGPHIKAIQIAVVIGGVDQVAIGHLRGLHAEAGGAIRAVHQPRHLRSHPHRTGRRVETRVQSHAVVDAILTGLEQGVGADMHQRG